MSSPPTLYFTLSPVEHIQEKLPKFRYMSCAIFNDRVAFGTSAGSVHIYQLGNPKPATVISIQSLINPVALLSFSPSGKWLVLGDSAGLHFIEEPLTGAYLFFSIPRPKPVTCVLWTSDPPGKLNKTTPYLIAGDDSGAVFSVRHQGSELLTTLPAGVLQLSTIGEHTLAATKNGAFIVQPGKDLPIGRKPPTGDFGAIYAQGFDAVCLARPEGKLAFADTTGRVKTAIPFLKGDESLPEGLSPNLSMLRWCNPFIVSAGRNHACYIVNLGTTSLVRLITDLGDLLDMSSDATRVLFLTRTRVVLFRVVTDVREYIRYLIGSGGEAVAARLVIQEGLKDPEIISALEGAGGPEFTEYVERLQRRSRPRPLAEADPDLHDQLMSTEVPTREMMDAVAAIRDCCLFDEAFRDRVDRFVLANPEEFELWREELHANFVVPLLNAHEDTADIAMEIAPLGDSELCRILASLDARSLDFCAANSPPIMAYNFKGERRKQFEERIQSYDIFVGPGDAALEEELLADSRYMRELERTKLQDLTPERTIALIKMYEWEVNVAKVIDELRTQLDVFLGSKQSGDLPQWVEDSMQSEKTGMRTRDGNPESGGNWGIPVELTTCPICGMKHNLGESVASVAVFPCAHTYHVSCLRTRHCPVCYSGCMD
jgi:hypothetical protein